MVGLVVKKPQLFNKISSSSIVYVEIGISDVFIRFWVGRLVSSLWINLDRPRIPQLTTPKKKKEKLPLIYMQITVTVLSNIYFSFHREYKTLKTI